MAVDRSLLAQALGKTTAQSFLDSSPNERALLKGNEISKFAMDSSNFGSGQARGVGLAAQLATAGIGAWAQNRARKEIAEKEVASQQSFAQQFPQYADMASQLSPETRQAYIVAKLSADLKAANPEPLTGIAKLGADYKAGLIDESTYRSAVKKETSFAPDASSL